MATKNGNGAVIAPLESWTVLHPAAWAALHGELTLTQPATEGSARSAALAEVLATSNRLLGNDVDRELDAWLGGADVIVTGQQPGLLGGPLLTLVKACAAAAEVRRRRASGGSGVAFLWLATADDDLPEMGWGRVAVGTGIQEVREPGWTRGQRTAGAAALSDATSRFLDALTSHGASDNARAAANLSLDCYAPGTTLGHATARFLARLLAGLGIVLVDACEPEIARAAAPVVEGVLAALPSAWDALAAGERTMRERGWPIPLRTVSSRLPVFRADGGVRHRIASDHGATPRAVFDEHKVAPERFLPNAWLRPLVQDAALGTSAAILGGAELAYHVQAAGIWDLARVRRPEWRLRPHVTVVTSAERRLASQLGVNAHDLLHAKPPRRVLPGKGPRRASARLQRSMERALGEFENHTRGELPGFQGDLGATRQRITGAIGWLDGRLEAALARGAEVEHGRWERLRAFIRPHGRSQERELSVLAPLLRLGLEWPAQLAASIDPAHPGMHLLFWEEGGTW